MMFSNALGPMNGGEPTSSTYKITLAQREYWSILQVGCKANLTVITRIFVHKSVSRVITLGVDVGSGIPTNLDAIS